MGEGLTPDQGLGAGFQPPCPIPPSIPLVAAAAPGCPAVPFASAAKYGVHTWAPGRREPRKGCASGSWCRLGPSSWNRAGGGTRGRDWAAVACDRTCPASTRSWAPSCSAPCGPEAAVARGLRQVRGVQLVPSVRGVAEGLAGLTLGKRTVRIGQRT